MPAPLPPGSTGLPLVGETLAFIGDPFGFVDERIARHGRIFRTHLLGRSAVVMSGADACSIWIDPDKVERSGAMPGNVEQLFGGKSLPLLDGGEHRSRKEQVLAGFGAEALASYVPAIESILAEAFERWCRAGEIAAVPETKALSIRILGRDVLGADDATCAALTAGYGELLPGFSALPFPIPGGGFAKGLAARDRIFALLRKIVGEHRANPKPDGLSRILAAAASDGSRISDDAVVLELHHAFLAGYIVFSHLVGSIRTLAERPELAASLRAEIAAAPAKEALSLRDLSVYPQLGLFVSEIKRTVPVFPLIFGRARSEFELYGYRVPAGVMVLWAWKATLADGEFFANPLEFAPQRFADPRSEQNRHPHAFSPHGPGPMATSHKCPGTDYATLIDTLFVRRLLQHEWTIPPQNLASKKASIPPEPADGLRIRIGVRKAAAAEAVAR